MSRSRSAWTNHLQDKAGPKKKTKKKPGEHLAQAAIEHDMLEDACVDIARLQYGVDLYKADAKGVRVWCKKSKKFIIITRCTSGIPDRIAVIPPTGRFAGFEFKISQENPKLRPNQEKVHVDMIRAGAALFTINSTRMFEECLRILLGAEKDKKRWQEIGDDREHE